VRASRATVVALDGGWMGLWMDGWMDEDEVERERRSGGYWCDPAFESLVIRVG